MGSFADWTVIAGEWSVYSGDKYAGNSSFQAAHTSVANAFLGRGTMTTARVILWARTYRALGSIATYIYHSSYGYVKLQDLTSGAITDWEQFRVSFWYDAASDTKFSRLEKNISGSWVQQGTDTNCGTGTPSANSIQLNSGVTLNNAGNYSLFDEIYVYALS